MTSLAYIDDVMEKELKTRHEKAEYFSDGEKDAAHKAGERTIAGFAVFDEDEEKAYLDKLVAKRRKAIEAFIADREKIRTKLKDLDITPLAVVPSHAWNQLCDKAELYRLRPDSRSQIRLCSYNFRHFMVENKKTKTNIFYGTKYETKSFSLRDKSEKEINDWAYANWPEFIKICFADSGGYGSDAAVGVRLPTPPADVAKVLCKASRLDLKVAAVAEAIRFDKSPYEIVKQATAQLEAAARLQEQRDADPIVYTEEGCATAIIAQFGDFPIEKAVVDAVVQSDDLIKTVDQAIVQYPTPDAIQEAMYRSAVEYQRAALQQQSQLNQLYLGTGVSNAFISNNTTSMPFSGFGLVGGLSNT